MEIILLRFSCSIRKVLGFYEKQKRNRNKTLGNIKLWKLDRRKVFWEKKEELGTYDIVQQEQEQAIFAD